jgi:hypothetical protein
MMDEFKTEKSKKTIAIAKVQKSQPWSSSEGATSCNAMKQQSHPTTCSSQYQIVTPLNSQHSIKFLDLMLFGKC